MSEEFSRYYRSKYSNSGFQYILNTIDILNLSGRPNFTDAFAKLPNLKELDLSFCGIQSYFDTDTLFKHIANMRLKKLSLMGCPLYIKSFDTTLLSSSTLEELNVAECRLGYMNVNSVRNLFRNLPKSLRVLNLASNSFGLLNGSRIRWSDKDINCVMKELPPQLEVFQYWDRSGNAIFMTNGHENLKVLPPKLKEIKIDSSELVNWDESETEVCNQFIKACQLLPNTTKTVSIDKQSNKFIKGFIASKLLEIPQNIDFIRFGAHTVDIWEQKALYLCKTVQNILSDKNTFREKFDFSSLNDVFKFNEIFTTKIIEKLMKQNAPIARFCAGLLYYGQIQNECFEQPNILKACECFLEAFHTTTDPTLKKMAKFYLWEIKTTNNHRFFNPILLESTWETYSSFFVTRNKRESYPPSQDFDIPRELIFDI